MDIEVGNPVGIPGKGTNNVDKTNGDGAKAVATGMQVKAIDQPNYLSLDDKFQELINSNRKVKVNKSKNHFNQNNDIKPESIDILQYNSMGKSLSLNGLITKEGLMLKKFCFVLKIIYYLIFNIDLMSSFNNVFLCRHYAHGFIKGLIKKEDLENIETAEQFLKIDFFQNFKKINDDGNITILDTLQSDIIRVLKRLLYSAWTGTHKILLYKG